MLKTWIATASVLAMMSGAAFAQSTTSETSTSSQTTTQAPAPATTYEFAQVADLDRRLWRRDEEDARTR